ncbi:hypothetical protein OSO01_07360 [Oceanobacillus sojae]|uniref:Uncharacterized protein n=1 Tax=Oceanobacillus sojae TaxID=582851 RepID=A0A511ZEX1_9BACI|nr:hypothetical protein OSO01_07360 [Oceanobacillus sojae]
MIAIDAVKITIKEKGILIKKTLCHPHSSFKNPPTIGENANAIPEVPDHTPKAIARFLGSVTVDDKSFVAIGANKAAPIP